MHSILQGRLSGITAQHLNCRIVENAHHAFEAKENTHHAFDTKGELSDTTSQYLGCCMVEKTHHGFDAKRRTSTYKFPEFQLCDKKQPSCIRYCREDFQHLNYRLVENTHHAFDTKEELSDTTSQYLGCCMVEKTHHGFDAKRRTSTYKFPEFQLCDKKAAIMHSILQGRLSGITAQHLNCRIVENAHHAFDTTWRTFTGLCLAFELSFGRKHPSCI
ncbi:hypothetical protein CDAR_565171 [Caerostris darwini]|uniref:Uncharacterized protein n=1 Tax=Caerostris darwini TaxID=1538125 RepID=A0AAV4TVJ6_9ARAC|nr:hypothetical protein CDAR_565171 [Caerostris darwini]